MIQNHDLKDKSELDAFEEEDMGSSEEKNIEIQPFDPAKVDVSILTPNLGTIIARLRHDEIDLLPDFQRSGDLWSPQEQSRLIESILIRLPIPAFYFDALIEDRWQVVDGLQRLSAITNFVINKTLKLTNLEFLTEFEGCDFDSLPRSQQRRIDEFQISVYLIKPGTPLEMKYSLFNRINTGGLKLNPQEIRHAMSQSVKSGRASKFLRELVREPGFLAVVKNSNHRMTHEELVLRHITFSLFGLVPYKSSLPKFLNLGMTELGSLGDSDYERLRYDFVESLKTAYLVFGEDAFKKTLAQPGHKKVINKPLFEAVSVCLAGLSDDERSYIAEYKDSYKKAFINLLQEPAFDISISKSTANTENVQTRFGRVRQLFMERM
jgi:hypothetical protein